MTDHTNAQADTCEDCRDAPRLAYDYLVALAANQEDGAAKLAAALGFLAACFGVRAGAPVLVMVCADGSRPAITDSVLGAVTILLGPKAGTHPPAGSSPLGSEHEETR